MQRVYVYSDESSRKGGEAVFVVAGLAIEAYHNVVWRALQQAEEESGKGSRDWHSTRDLKTRRRYLEVALAIPEIEGRVFYRVYGVPLADPWSATVATLAEVVERFGGEEKTCVLAREGFTKGSREKLKRAVERRRRGLRSVRSTRPRARHPHWRPRESRWGLRERPDH